MSLTVGELAAFIGLDDAEYNRGIDNAERRFRTLGGSIDRMSTGMLTSLNEFGGKVNDVIWKGMQAGLAAGLAGVGVVIAKGFSRLRAIDDAQAKLRGLGHDADTLKVIMDNALASVLGTAYGLDAAATTAATVVASGIKPGRDLERTLRLVADAAAIANIGMDDMSVIFGKVAASNRLTMYEINQLALRGVPILEWLGDQYGVTAFEARKMVERGKVDFAAFQEAVETHIGGAALKMGDSWSGAWANMWAAVSRFGVALMGPVFEQMKGWFTGMIGVLDQLTAAAKPWGERFGSLVESGVARAVAAVTSAAARIRRAAEDIRSGFDKSAAGVATFAGGFERIGAVLQRIKTFFDENRESLGKLGKALGTAAPLMLALASVTNILARAWQFLVRFTPVGIILGLVTALVYAYQNSERFRDVVLAAFDKVKAAVAPLGEAFERLAPVIGEALARVAEKALPVFEGVVTVITDLLAAFVSFITGPAGTKLIEGAFSALVSALETLGRIFAQVWPTIKTIVQGVVDWLNSPAGTKLIEVAFQAISTALGILASIFEAVWPVIQGVVEAFIGWFNSESGQKLITRLLEIIGTVLQALQSVFEMVWPLIASAVQGFIDWFSSDSGQGLITFLLDAIGDVLGALQGVFQTVWPIIEQIVKKFIDFFNSSEGQWLIRSLLEGIARATQTLKDVWDKVWPALEAVLKVVGVMIQNNLRIIKAAIDGVAKAIQAVQTAYDKLKRSGAFATGPSSLQGPVGGGGVVARAAGGLVTRPEYALIGEAGPELVLPLADRARTKQLLEMVGLSDIRRSHIGPAAGNRDVYVTIESITINGGRQEAEEAVGVFTTRLQALGVLT